MDFLQNSRKSLAVAGDFTDKYDRQNYVNPITPASSVRVNNRIAGW